MNKLIKLLALAGFIFGFSSCVDEINIALEESNQAMVIEAWVGNIPDENFVKVYRTRAYISGALNPEFLPVLVKSVIIEQNEGEDIPFGEVDGNIFRQSYSFIPVPGRSYRLVVETEEGEVFESSWETMPPYIEIEDILTEAFEKQVLVTSGQTQFSQIRTFADVQAQITDQGLDNLGYLLETSGISELYTSSLSDNCACSCYENDPNIFAGMNINSSSLFQGKSVQLSLGEIPLSSIGRFFVSTKLKVLTKSNYEFLNQLDQQQRNTGSIFDPAPFRIKGNIKKRGDENDMVLGGFFLYQESAFEKLLYRTQIRSESLDLGHALEPVPAVNISCDEYYFNASPIVPPSFKP